jgi:hypothetical protein
MVQKRQLIFVATLIASAWASACGRQVTPNPPGLGAGGAPPGFLAIHFNVVAPFNFSNYRYMIVFNTTDTGPGPSTDTFQTNWAGYSSAAVALGNGATSSAELVHFLRNQNPHIPPFWQVLITTPQQFTYNLNSNGTGTEFSIVAQKSIFAPLPSPSPSAGPSNIWTFNAFTTQAGGGGQFLFADSLGQGGPIDPQFVSPELCMTEPFDNTYYARGYTPPDPSAQIVSIEISNNPARPTPCP